MKLCIIGAGASGILLILLLHQNKVTMRDVVIIDPHFDGGSLQRSWGSVLSNTTWAACLGAIQTYLPSYKIPDWALRLSPDSPTPLDKIAELLRFLSQPVFSSCKIIKGFATKVAWNSGTSLWTVETDYGIHIQSSAIVFAQGSLPKYLNLPIPSVPLSCALDPIQVQRYIKDTDRVLVFGTSHSGTLILKNLVDCSAESIVGIYKGTKPFVWARDGAYDGIKMEAATIADSIMQNKYPSVKLVPFENTFELMKESRGATWVIYAMGFMPDTAIKAYVDCEEISLTSYAPHTGCILGAPKAFGLGIAYPSSAPDELHYDVGISSFLEYFNKLIPSIILHIT